MGKGKSKRISSLSHPVLSLGHDVTHLKLPTVKVGRTGSNSCHLPFVHFLQPLYWCLFLSPVFILFEILINERRQEEKRMRDKEMIVNEGKG